MLKKFTMNLAFSLSNYRLFTENLCRFNYASTALIPPQATTIARTSNRNNNISNCICPSGFGGSDCEIREIIRLICIDLCSKY